MSKKYENLTYINKKHIKLKKILYIITIFTVN